MEASELVEAMTLRERLVFAQAIYEYGTQDWAQVAQVLKKHPLVTQLFYNEQTCLDIYRELQHRIGYDFEGPAPPETALRKAKPNLVLAQFLYKARFQQLRGILEANEKTFRTTMHEMEAIKAGEWDSKIAEEFRATQNGGHTSSPTTPAPTSSAHLSVPGNGVAEDLTIDDDEHSPVRPARSVSAEMRPSPSTQRASKGASDIDATAAISENDALEEMYENPTEDALLPGEQEGLESTPNRSSLLNDENVEVKQTEAEIEAEPETVPDEPLIEADAEPIIIDDEEPLPQSSNVTRVQHEEVASPPQLSDLMDVVDLDTSTKPRLKDDESDGDAEVESAVNGPRSSLGPNRKRKATGSREPTEKKRPRTSKSMERSDDRASSTKPPSTARSSVAPNQQPPPKAFLKAMTVLHDRISSFPAASLFEQPVNPQHEPDYETIIKQPMDLTTLKKMLKSNQIRSIGEYERFIYLILANAVVYNRPGDEVYVRAKEMMVMVDGAIGQTKSMDAGWPM